MKLIAILLAVLAMITFLAAIWIPGYESQFRGTGIVFLIAAVFIGVAAGMANTNQVNK